MTINLALSSFTALGSASRTFGDRFGELTNVKDFGAVGDGNTNALNDDTTAIQNAVTSSFGSFASPKYPSANKGLYFPPGVYQVTAPIQIPLCLGTRIYGAGSRVTKVKYVGSLPNVPLGGNITALLSTGGGQFLVIEGLSLDMPSTGLTTSDPATISASPHGITCCLLIGPAGSGTFTYFNSCVDVATYNADVGQYQIGGNQGGDGNLCLQCEFNGHGVAGIYAPDPNVLAGTAVNCLFVNCGSPTPGGAGLPLTGAVLCHAGTMQTFLGCLFKDSNGTDIVNDTPGPIYCAGCTFTNSRTDRGDHEPTFVHFINMTDYLMGCSFSSPNATSNWAIRALSGYRSAGVNVGGTVFDACDFSGTRGTSNNGGGTFCQAYRGCSGTASLLVGFAPTGVLIENI